MVSLRVVSICVCVMVAVWMLCAHRHRKWADMCCVRYNCALWWYVLPQSSSDTITNDAIYMCVCVLWRWWRSMRCGLIWNQIINDYSNIFVYPVVVRCHHISSHILPNIFAFVHTVSSYSIVYDCVRFVVRFSFCCFDCKCRIMHFIAPLPYTWWLVLLQHWCPCWTCSIRR